MRRGGLRISPGAAIGTALLLILLRGEELAALLPAVLIHELGHLAAMLALGQRPLGVSAELGGLCLDYAGDAGTAGRALIAAAGPVAGLAYAAVSARLGRQIGQDWLCLSAGISLLLSLVNLLPAPPLDGGQICNAMAELLLGPRRAEKLCRALGALVGLALLGGGLLSLLRGRGGAPAFLGAWLLLSLLRDGEGLVKRKETR